MVGEKFNAATIADGVINYVIISISWPVSLIVFFNISYYIMAK